jgi:hypothetical protein
MKNKSFKSKENPLFQVVKRNSEFSSSIPKHNLQSNQYKPSSSGYTIEEKTKYTSKK